MPAMKEIICACGCGRKRMVRLADIKRGWGRFYNKSCKAKNQEKKTGQYKEYINRNSSEHEQEIYVHGFGKDPVFDDSRDW